MQGAGEYPLSARGREQALGAAAFGEISPDIVVASDLERAVDTARLLFGRVDRIDERLRERGAGPWEGRPRAELEAAFPGALDDDARRPEGFEPADDVVARMRSACVDLLGLGGFVVAITHGAVLRLLERSLGGPGGRFRHLEGLELAADLVPVRRWDLLEGGRA